MIDEYNFQEYLYQSPILKANNSEIFQLGMSALFRNDHITASHILIPQIEAAFRRLIELSGGNVLTPSKEGGYNYKTLDTILREQIIEDAFGTDTAIYLRVLLTDNKGLNIRNKLSHGLLNDNNFNYIVSDRIFHTLLLLSTLRYDDAQ